MRRSAFADAAAGGDWAFDSLAASASSMESQGMALPASFSRPPLPSPPEQQKQQGEPKAAPLFPSSRGGGGAAPAPAPDADAPERRSPPDSWLRRARWRGAVSGALSALALLCLLALLASAALSSSSTTAVSSPSSASSSRKVSPRGGGFAPRASFPPPRLLSNDAKRALPLSSASKLKAEAGHEAGEKEGGGGVASEEATFFASRSSSSPFSPSLSSSSSSPRGRGRTLVSYAYFEKDAVQAANLAFFSAFGMGLATKEEKGGSGSAGRGRSGKGKGLGRRRSPFLPPPPPATDFFVIVSGPACTPCAMFSSFLSPDTRARLPGAPRGISGAWSGVVEAATEEEIRGATREEEGPAERGPATASTVTLLHRFENDGMDFGAHNVTLEWVAFLERHERGGSEAEGGGGAAAAEELEEPKTAGEGGGGGNTSRHRRLIFLNSSARGPFLPTYLPEGWQWTDAFSRDLDEEEEEETAVEEEGEEETSEEKRSKLRGTTVEKKGEKKKVALVGAALTCLPSVDAGGPGPRVESWAFALSQKGLVLAKESGVFGSHGCKLCADGVVVAGEKERERDRERESIEESDPRKKMKEEKLKSSKKNDNRGVRPLARRASLRAQPRHTDEPLREGGRLEPRGALGLQRQRAPFAVREREGEREKEKERAPFLNFLKKRKTNQNFTKNRTIEKNSHATYDGVDMHPFETLFVKASWNVGEPFVSAYSRWGARLASSSSPPSSPDDGDGDGGNLSGFDAGTRGTFDEPRYRYAISPEAQEDWGVAECFGKGAPPPPERGRREGTRGSGGGEGKDGGGVDDGGWRAWWQT